MIQEYLDRVGPQLGSLPSRDRALVLDGLRDQLLEVSSEGGDDAVVRMLAELGEPEELAARYVEELRDTGRRHGDVLGIPYDFRPTGGAGSTLWSAAEVSALPVKSWGVGTGLNLGALAVRLGLVEPDDDDDRTWAAVPRSAVLALPGMAVSAAVTAVMTTVTAWSRLPDRVPTHWGVDGAPDRWAPAVWAVAVLLGAVLLAAAWAVGAMIRQRRRPRRAVGASALASLIAWSGTVTLLAALVMPGYGLPLGVLGLLAILALTAVVPGLVLRSGVRRLASGGPGP
jgi:hypothetical protein